MAARKAPASNDDKENDSQLALRKKPLRRGTSKNTSTTTTTPATKPTRRTAAPIVEAPAPKASPLSPKKVTQVARGNTADVQAETKKAAPAPATRAAATRKPALQAAATRPKRQTRATSTTVEAAAKPSPRRAPVTRRKAALPEAARGKASRTRKAQPEPEPQIEPEIEDEEADDEEDSIAVALPEETVAEDEQLEESEVQDATNSAHIQDEEDQEQEPVEEVKQTQPTPTMRITRSHDIQQEEDEAEAEDKADQSDEEEDDASSDDELCGPKTPMRRTISPVKSQTASRQPHCPTTARKLHTPARRFLVHRANQGTPQTQRMPLKSARLSSPQRPMTVSRGAEKAMVFRPLKRTSLDNASTPEADESVDIEQPEVQNDSGSKSSADELENDDPTLTMATPARGIHFEADASDSEDELAGQSHISYSDEEEEDAEDTVVGENETKIESDYEDVQLETADDVSDASLSIIDHSEIEDSILSQPQLSADIEDSVLSSPESDVMEPPAIDVEDSELLSSPTPSTPGSVVRQDLDIEETPTVEIAPVPRLSITDRELLSLIEDEESSTPNPKSRMSFSTATAKMLQTPRMQFALGGVDAMEVDNSPSVAINEPVQSGDEHTMTINPSLLGVDEDGVQLAHKMENAATIPTPYLATPLASERLSMGLSKERMSLLQDDIFNLIDFDHASPAKVNNAEPEVKDQTNAQQEQEAASTVEQAQEMTTPQPKSRRQSCCPMPTLLPNQTPRSHSTPLVAPTPPSYARPTFAFNARRQSMPVVGSLTPAKADLRPRTADTTIKPTTSDSFAKLWASKQRRPSVRRLTIGSDSPRVSGPHTPVFTEQPVMRKRESMPMQRSTSSIRIQAHSASPYMPFSGAKPRRHTPSSSLKPRSSSRSPIKRLREAPRTPIKTPLKSACLATPAAYPMTPHPLQPLKSVTALVEVFTLDGSSASGPFIALLQGLGARTTKTWSDRVTHVIFKDGSPSTLQKVRLTNKEGNKKIFCVNSRWVTDCERSGTRIDEQADIYAVDLDEVPRGGRRRNKSMEPAALRNVDGNVIASGGSHGSGGSNGSRKSIGRQSIGRNKSLARASLASSFWGEDSPVKKTPGGARKSWDDDEEMADAFFDEPTAKFDVPVLGLAAGGLEKGQMTMPVNRVKKMDLRGEDNRRLTFMIGRD